MPHVVLNGEINVEEIFRSLKPIFIKEDSKILRTNDFYLERGKQTILIDALAVDSTGHRNFLAMISEREDGIVVRIYPKFEIQKTESVKRLLAEIAKQIIQIWPQLKIGETNLIQYLK